MPGVTVAAQGAVLPVGSQGVLGQVVGADAEEVHFVGQGVTDDGGGGRFNHDAQGHVSNGDALGGQLLPDGLAQGFDLLDLPQGGNHGEHHADRTVGAGPVDGPQLGPEQLRTAQAQPHAAKAQGGVFFGVQLEIVGLLVGANVQGTDDDGTALQALHHLTVCGVQLLLGGVGVAAQVQELAAQQTHAFTVIFQYQLHVVGAADVGVELDLAALGRPGFFAAVGFQRFLGGLGFGLLGGHLRQGGLVGPDVALAGETVHNDRVARMDGRQIDIGGHQGGDAHGPGQNGRVAVGGALAGHKGQNLVFGQLYRLRRCQVLGQQNAGNVHGHGGGEAAEDLHHPAGHVPNVGGTGFHVLIVHGGKHLREFLAGLLDGVGGAVAAVNAALDGFHIVQIVQHHDLNVQNHGVFLTQTGSGLLQQRLELRLGLGLGVGEPLPLLGGGAPGGGQFQLGRLMDEGRSDGNAGEYRQACSLYHGFRPSHAQASMVSRGSPAETAPRWACKMGKRSELHRTMGVMRS